jgi:hypothetical protein
MGRFEPETDSKTPSRSRGRSAKVALRLFDPAKRAKARIRSDIPLDLSFDGRSGEVIEHSAPWLASGDWWNEMTYDRKQWDVEVQFQDGARAKYLIFVDLFTNQPFVEGSYD